jgi:hypothetical protein
VALTLISFVLVAAGVIWRRASGLARSTELRELQAQRAQLVTRRARIESEIRDLSSRSKLAPIVERRLHMRVPNDSQVIILPRTPATR